MSATSPKILRTWKDVFYEFLVSLLIGIVAALLVPKLLSGDFVVRQMARIYAPVAAWLQGEEKRNDISVLLIDDKTLADAGEAWPASYRYHARLIDALALKKPRAVFFDIVFSSERPDATLPALTRALCDLSDGGTKVYLAAQRQADQQFRLRPELEAIHPRCFKKVAIEYQPDKVDQTAWVYKLSDQLGVTDSPRSAALAIYEDVAGTLPVVVHRSDLALTWGLEPAKKGVDWAAPPIAGSVAAVEGQVVSPEAYCRAPEHAIVEVLPWFLRRMFSKPVSKPVCVFHETLYPADLVTSTDAEENFLKERLEGKIVLVGTALQGSNDRVQSPIHGRIPGVYLHAAALNNLLKDGESYKQVTTLGLPWTVQTGNALVILLCGFFFVFLARWVEGLPLIKRFSNWIQFKERSLKQGETFLLKSWRKTYEALGWVVWKALVLVSSFMLFALLLMIGLKCFNVGFMTVIDVVVFALAAQWLKWSAKLLAWMQDKPEEAKEA